MGALSKMVKRLAKSGHQVTFRNGLPGHVEIDVRKMGLKTSYQISEIVFDSDSITLIDIMENIEREMAGALYIKLKGL